MNGHSRADGAPMAHPGKNTTQTAAGVRHQSPMANRNKPLDHSGSAGRHYKGRAVAVERAGARFRIRGNVLHHEAMK
eukprot:scaffold17714_cov115-Isochrysis_galbana.AAC.2